MWYFCYFWDLKIRNKDRLKCDLTIGNKYEGLRVTNMHTYLIGSLIHKNYTNR